MIPTADLCNMPAGMTTGIPDHQGGESGLKPSQTHCTPQNYFSGCLVYLLCFGLNYRFTLPLTPTGDGPLQGENLL